MTKLPQLNDGFFKNMHEAKRKYTKQFLKNLVENGDQKDIFSYCLTRANKKKMEISMSHLMLFGHAETKITKTEAEEAMRLACRWYSRIIKIARKHGNKKI